jgi:hypothetical protein
VSAQGEGSRFWIELPGAATPGIQSPNREATP